MGLGKLDHIRAIGAKPRVARAWARARAGAEFEESDASVLPPKRRAAYDANHRKSKVLLKRLA